MPLTVQTPKSGNALGAVTFLHSDGAGIPGNPVNLPGDAELDWQWNPDSKRVAFSSPSSNLVPGDTNESRDSFVKNVMTGEIVRVSTSSDGTQANALSFSGTPAWSPDGRRVAFDSTASNLVPGDTTGYDDDGMFISYGDIFVKDLVTGTTDRVSTGADGSALNGLSNIAGAGGWSPSGTKIAFSSEATNLTAEGNRHGLYIKNLNTGHVDFFGVAGRTLRAVQWLDDQRLFAQGQLIQDGCSGKQCWRDTQGFLLDQDTGRATRVDQVKRSLGSMLMLPNPSGRSLLIQPAGLGGLYVKNLATGRSTTLSQRSNGFSYGNVVGWSPSGKNVYLQKGCQFYRARTRVGGFQVVRSDSAPKGAKNCIQRVELAPNGRWVAFRSSGRGWVPGDRKGANHVFRMNLRSGAVERIDTTASGQPGNSDDDPYAPGPSWAPDSSKIVVASSDQLASNNDPYVFPMMYWRLYVKTLSPR